MSLFLRHIVNAILVCFFLGGCDFGTPSTPSNVTGDITPPVFDDLRVQLTVPTDGNLRGDFDIKTANANVSHLQSDISFRIRAIAGDSESGITNVEIKSELTFSCASARGSEITGIVQTIALPFTAIPNPSPNSTFFQFETTTSPSPVEATGCAIASDGRGPIGMAGFVYVRITNGANLTFDSPRFVFDYADVGSR